VKVQSGVAEGLTKLEQLKAALRGVQEEHHLGYFASSLQPSPRRFVDRRGNLYPISGLLLAIVGLTCASHVAGGTSRHEQPSFGTVYTRKAKSFNGL
jgi:hypothetical protein